MRSTHAIALSLCLMACGEDGPIEVVVDVQTDLVPGVEFQSAQVQLGERTGSVAVAFEDDFRVGRRVAEFVDVETGPVEMAVLLADAGGGIVLRRDVSLDIRESIGLTVVLTRNCLGIECPAAGPETVATTCVDGRCLPRDCSSQNRAACGTPACMDVRSCAVRAECAAADCIDGICLEFGDSAMCAAGEYCHPETGCTARPVDDLDADGDGIVEASDCDDMDPAVGFRAERTCTSDCATGLEQCVTGMWLACDAPTDCDCTPGETRELSCERCGTITQTCTTGTWESGACADQGECSPGALEDVGSCGRCGSDRRTCLDTCAWDAPTCIGEGECASGETEDEMMSCGTCGEARTRMRTCSATCAWGAWGAYGTCSAGSGCMPGEMASQMRGCGSCGMQQRTRTCQMDCTFASWSTWGACTGEGSCAPGTVSTETRACGGCGTGTELRSRTCTSACTWSAYGAWGGCATAGTAHASGGDVNTCFTRTDGALYCAGDNDNGQLGDGTTSRSTSPARVGTATGWTRVSINGRYESAAASNLVHTCAIRAGELWCWGYNSRGQLGIGSRTDQRTPQRVGTDSDWADVSVGAEEFTCGLKTTGALFCWGEGGDGRLGLGGSMDYDTPQALAGTSWASVSAGDLHACARRTDDTIWCWGDGSAGQIGQGDQMDQQSPVQIGVAEWTVVAAGGSHTCGVKRSGELWCWGYNGFGELGQGTTSSRETSPLRVGTDTDWSTVAGGGHHTCAIKSGGTMWCWGDGDEGQLGDGRARDTYAPVQAGTDTGWAFVDAGNEHSCGIRGGALYCWGDGGQGRLGTGMTSNVITPALICP